MLTEAFCIEPVEALPCKALKGQAGAVNTTVYSVNMRLYNTSDIAYRQRIFRAYGASLQLG